MTEPIRIGLAGAGRAGWGMHCQELEDKKHLFTIVAACDLIESRRQAMAERYGCKTYERLEELMADPDVELVDVATRSSDHCAHGLLALAGGKHVFMEKPLACTYEEAQLLLEAERKSTGKLYVRHNRRFDPDFLHVREVMESGILGDIYAIRLCRHGYQRRDDWQTIMAYGGGQLLNWGPHIIDHGLRLLESPVAELWTDLKRVAAVGDAEDHVKIIMKGQNNRLVDLEISGGVAEPSPQYAVYGARGTLTVVDNQISLRYLDPAVPLKEKRADPGTPGETFGSAENLSWRTETMPVAPVKSYNIWEELYRSIRLGETFPIALEEALEVMRVISEAKQASAFTG